MRIPGGPPTEPCRVRRHVKEPQAVGHDQVLRAEDAGQQRFEAVKQPPVLVVDAGKGGGQTRLLQPQRGVHERQALSLLNQRCGDEIAVTREQRLGAAER